MRHWARRGAVARLLWPAAAAFGAAAALRRAAYRLRLLPSAHPGIRVIVVGNLSAGGTGKTPLVLWIAEFLRSQGWTPAIVSRGYGAALEAMRHRAPRLLDRLLHDVARAPVVAQTGGEDRAERRVARQAHQHLV